MSGIFIEIINSRAHLVVYIRGEALPITTREPTYRQMTWRQARKLLESAQ